jgi:hypothetical protein
MKRAVSHDLYNFGAQECLFIAFSLADSLLLFVSSRETHCHFELSLGLTSGVIFKLESMLIVVAIVSLSNDSPLLRSSIHRSNNRISYSPFVTQGEVPSISNLHTCTKNIYYVRYVSKKVNVKGVQKVTKIHL